MNRKTSSLKKICMLSTHGYFDPVPQLGRTDTGGQVVYVLQLAKALTTYDIKVDIYTRWFDRTKPQIDPVPDNADVRVIRIPAGPWEFIPKEEIYDVLPELAANMTAFIRQHSLDYDLFHGHYVDAGIITLDVARAFDRPAFFTAHSLGAWKREQMGGDPAEMERKFRFSHRIAEELRIFRSVRAQTVTTGVQKEKLEELYGFTSGDVAVISPGVDIHTFRPLESGESRMDIGLPERYILCLSRIDSNKGHDLLLNAFSLVCKSVPDIHLVIGGGSTSKAGPTELEVLANMKRIIAEKKMEKQVHITGYIPDEHLVAAYRQAEMFVLPSIFEPFGMTALESMACGRPVVASRLGGIREVVTSEESGLLVDPADPAEFSTAIIRLLNDKPLAGRISEQGREIVRERYSWEAIAVRHIEFYEKYLNR
ncbi:MAG TPA: glycosyltransferase family 1 protein [Dehalococcoidia bacterium]|nr:glycosyltransferase family 1 protein [Dehalococcoidia bacterium]